LVREIEGFFLGGEGVFLRDILVKSKAKQRKNCCDRREKRRGRKKERVAKAECLPVYREAKRGERKEESRKKARAQD